MSGDEGAEAAKAVPTISNDAVSKVDLSALGDLDETGLREHFQGIATLATPAQLRLFLDGQSFSGLGDETHEQLGERYVARRMGVVRDLLEARDRMNRNLDSYLGSHR